MNILLVEDNKADATLLMALCEGEGFAGEFHCVSDGMEALHFLFGNGHPPDGSLPHLVMLDLGLPKLDGHGVLRAIRARVDQKNLPVIILTTSNRELDRTEAEQCGITDFITKPMSLGGYEELVRRLVNEQFPKCTRDGRTLTV